MLLHYLAHIGGSLLIGDAFLVDLFSFGNQAQTARLPPSIKFFDCVVDTESPYPKIVLKTTTSNSFLDLTVSSTVELFKNIALLLPCVSSAMITAPSLAPADLDALAVTAADNTKTRLETYPYFDYALHDKATKYIVSFLW